MRLKTILAKNIPEGMRRVREQLGDDAVIVQTEETDSGVMIMAATESPPAIGFFPGDGGAEGDPWHELPSDPAETVSEALEYHRVPAQIIETLLSAPETWDLDDPVMALGGALRSRFDFAPLALERITRPLLLVGPPGAGKTVTAAKLATVAVMSGMAPALICADTERAGGAEQLRTFATALKLDMPSARGAPDLQDALISAGKRRPIIIDGPALNPLEPADANLVCELAAAAGAEAVLVIPAGLDASEAEDMALSCKDLGVTQYIATRLDASRRLGALISTAATGLAPAAFGISRRIVEGLRPAEPESLARAILNGSTSNMSSPQQRRSEQAPR